MTAQSTFPFEAPPTDIVVDSAPDQYGLFFARPVKLGTVAPIITGSGARTPAEAERYLRRMLASESKDSPT